MEKEPNKESESTRQLLLQAAKGLFAKQGFEGTSIKDIVDKAGVNVSLVSYYFQGKQGLYRACLKEYGHSKLDMAKRLLQSPQSSEELRVRLQMFFSEVLESFVQDPDLIILTHRACDEDTELTQDIFFETFYQIFFTLAEFIKAGQERGLVKKGVDCRLIASLTFGALAHQIRVDALNERIQGRSLKQPKYRKQVIECLTMQFSSGFAQPD